MSFVGRIEDGKVVFDGPAPLPDGTPVRVAPAEPSAPKPVPDAELPSQYDQLKHVIGKATGLPEDYSGNLDQYQYGTPKRVEPVPPPEVPPADIPPLRERLKNVLGKAVGLPEDAATNHDKYIRESHRQ